MELRLCVSRRFSGANKLDRRPRIAATETRFIVRANENADCVSGTRIGDSQPTFETEEHDTDNFPKIGSV
jgi:hypothetical protein